MDSMNRKQLRKRLATRDVAYSFPSRQDSSGHGDGTDAQGSGRGMLKHPRRYRPLDSAEVELGRVRMRGRVTSSWWGQGVGVVAKDWAPSISLSRPSDVTLFMAWREEKTRRASSCSRSPAGSAQREWRGQEGVEACTAAAHPQSLLQAPPARCGGMPCGCYQSRKFLAARQRASSHACLLLLAHPIHPNPLMRPSLFSPHPPTHPATHLPGRPPSAP